MNNIRAIRNLMSTMDLTAQQAMDVMVIPAAQQAVLASML